jgi:hypothetical protein
VKKFNAGITEIDLGDRVLNLLVEFGERKIIFQGI